MKSLLENYRDKLKPEVIWNIEKGLNLTGAEIATAEAQRGAMFRRTLDFFKTYDLLLCPATIVAAYPVEQRYLAECNGLKFSTYIDWLAIVYAITNVSCPAISIPMGFTSEKLPVGLQVVAPPRGEAALLGGASFIESLLGYRDITPIDPR
jgi:amidase